jgi:hypothetical protein
MGKLLGTHYFHEASAFQSHSFTIPYSIPPSFQYVKENWTPFCSLYLFTVDPYLLLQQVSDFDLFTLDDVDAAFQNVVRLKYSQNYLLNGQ